MNYIYEYHILFKIRDFRTEINMENRDKHAINFYAFDGYRRN